MSSYFHLTEYFEDDIILGPPFGRGGFGSVCVAGIRGEGRKVAVKYLHDIEDSLITTEDLKREADAMCASAHQYVLQPVGRLMRSPGRCNGLILPLMKFGSLKNFPELLKSHKHMPEESRWATKWMWLYQIAEGMAHVHSLSPPLLHLDLKPDNVLLDDELSVKITDFGLARMSELYAQVAATGDYTEHAVGGTYKYIPPEYIQNSRRRPCTKFDVYSYSMVIYFVLEESAPYKIGHPLQTKEDIKDLVLKGGRPEITCLAGRCPGSVTTEMEQLVDLMKRCWSQKYASRPEFKGRRGPHHNFVYLNGAKDIHLCWPLQTSCQVENHRI